MLRLSDFLCAKRLLDVFVAPIGGVIFCAERLLDFFVPRGCLIFLCREVA